MNIGISIYPHLLGVKDQPFLKQHLQECKKANICIIFTTLINLKNNNKDAINLLKFIVTEAKKLNMLVYGDINNDVLREFNLNESEYLKIVSFFQNQFGLDGIRIDDGISLNTIAQLSNNASNCTIIINASIPSKDVEFLLSIGAKKANLLACWNFYPQKYSAVSIEFFKKNNNYFIKNGIRVQAFVAIQRHDASGPWKYNDKLPTIEYHRDKSLNYQLRHLSLLGISDAIISTQFLEANELNEIQQISFFPINIFYNLANSLSDIEYKILNDQDVHFVRPDLSEYFIRSTYSRIKYDGKKIKSLSKNIKKFKIGDVLILNSNSFNYAGELQIVLKEFKNDGIRNMVAKLTEEEIKLLSEIKSFDKFKLVQK